MRHTKVRNVIERAFAVLKMRWGIHRSASFYPIKVQTRLVMACFLLHNYVIGEMIVDPLDELLETMVDTTGVDHDPGNVEFVDYVEATEDWNMFRDQLANSMCMGYSLQHTNVEA
ncbi:uncharacterized protein LOC121810455 [Salvia splendens]|uniref:uncharacterized protein LOC121810455 n=1 Tax=Salvia splendens TaxID=180675 RepID=UPI001C27F7C8|nr:uncharacterized protein LOC121810455 [Salvia splendens]